MVIFQAWNLCSYLKALRILKTVYLLLHYIGADDCQCRYVRDRWCHVCRTKLGRKMCELWGVGWYHWTYVYNTIAEVSHKPRSLQPSSAVLQVQSTLVVPRLYSAQTKVSVKGFQGIRRYLLQSLSLCGATDQLAPRPPLLRFLYHTQLHSLTHTQSRKPLDEWPARRRGG